MYIIIKGKQVLSALFLCVLVIGAAIATVVHVVGATAVTTSTDNTNWGLSFRQQGKAPEGNVTAEYLRQYNSFYVGSSDKKIIYLTFDAGYESGYTPAILDVLKKQNVKAVFFLVGNYLNKNPELVKRMCDEGHLVGNHTFNHPDMSKIMNREKFVQELQSLEELYKQITKKEMPKLYRPPQGKYSESNLKMAMELGYKTVFWSLAYVDWYDDKQPTREQAFEKLLPRIHPGAVVLLHSTSKTNAEILDELLTKWKSEGYTFSTLDKL